MTKHKAPGMVDGYIKMIQSEIKWCEKNPIKAFSPEYRKGFINGLIQAIYLINQTDKILED